MPADQQVPQSYANHTRFDPWFHYFSAPAAFAYVVWSLVRLVRQPSVDDVYALLGALAIFGGVSVARLSPLRAQDRLIRLEERLRFARLLPADLASQAEAALSTRHYVALRFASDAELEGLVREVLATPTLTGKEIKQKIRNWKGDYLRV